MNIGIIGAGNIGTYLGTYISLNKNNKVWMHTSKPESFKAELILIEEEKNVNHKVKLYCVTSSLQEVVENSEILLITHPSFMMKDTLKEVSKYAKSGTIIGAIPGFGGKEYYIDELLEKGCIFFGSQRVPSITRLESYGECVLLKQKNDFMRLAVIPNRFKECVCEKITSLIDIPCLHLGITLSPSNPTMHPSRLYELFKDYKEGIVYDKHSLFYEEWGNEASTTLIELDEELKDIFNSINEFSNFNEDDFERIKYRYKISEPSELTEKIRTAPGFQTIKTPMIKCENGYLPDLNSRYFIEDIQFGLCIIKAFAEICDVKTPVVDKVIYWGQKLLGKEYLVTDSLCGNDVQELVIPQNIGITTKIDLIKYYSNF
ncbi:NAD/NADP octopine/nopaline dehydrogenase family protein [Clostridium sp. B9]|uniref:NAD/NADP octopine/nopaline dehydrogenase family protein n=1 Tax=Clostridium sp. B9 TaxID=3423224 RepID=UPI003D2F43A7